MRALFLASSLAMFVLAGCSTRTIDELTGPTGTCVDKPNGTLLGCAQGSYCTSNGTAVQCQPTPDAGGPTTNACGVIRCDARYCQCASDASASTCECVHGVP